LKKINKFKEGFKKSRGKGKSVKGDLKKSKSMHSKLLQSMFLISILPMIIICSVAFIKINDITSSNFKSSSTTSTLGSKKLLDSQLESIINTLISFSKKDIFVKGNISNKSTIEEFPEIEKDLQLIKESNSSILSISFAFDKSKSYYYYPEKTEPSDFDPTSREAYKGAAQFRDTAYITNVYKNTESKNDCVTISYGVRKNNESIGVISVDLDLMNLSKNLTNMLDENDNYEFILCDVNGQVIASTNDTLIDTKEVVQYPIWNDISSNATGVGNFSFGNQNYLASYATSEVTGWKFISKIPENVLTQSRNSLIRGFSLIIIMVIIAIIIISTRFSNSLSKNILKIRNAINEAALGDFNSKIQINSKDELENLANSFNNMCTNVSSVLNNVNSSVEDVNSAAINLDNKSKELSSAISNVNDTINKIDLGTTDSTNNLELLTSNMEDVSNSINRIDTAAANVNSMASKANSLSEFGLDIINALIDKANETRKITYEVNDVIQLVSKSVEQIATMNDTITQITKQTNLLSLNASIEAARAGEAGRGFTVVAGEIKKLAEQTELSAKEISNIIMQVKTNVNNAVEKANETNAAVENQQNSVKQSHDIFADIITSINTLGAKVNDISKDLGDLANKKDEVLNQVQSLSSIVVETSDGAGNVACVCQQVNETTIEFLDSSHKLKRLSDNLQSEINKFNYK
jgi:methyl-accepting chemotaxis protein